MTTTTPASPPGVADCGHSIITVDDTPEGLVWSADDRRYHPTVVVRMTPWYADRRAQTLADWSDIVDMMDDGGGRCERRFAALLMRAALLAMGRAEEEADTACRRILAHLDAVPEQRDPLLRWRGQAAE